MASPMMSIAPSLRSRDSYVVCVERNSKQDKLLTSIMNMAGLLGELSTRSVIPESCIASSPGSWLRQLPTTYVSHLLPQLLEIERLLEDLVRNVNQGSVLVMGSEPW